MHYRQAIAPLLRPSKPSIRRILKLAIHCFVNTKFRFNKVGWKEAKEELGRGTQQDMMAGLLRQQIADSVKLDHRQTGYTIAAENYCCTH